MTNSVILLLIYSDVYQVKPRCRTTGMSWSKYHGYDTISKYVLNNFIIGIKYLHSLSIMIGFLHSNSDVFLLFRFIDCLGESYNDIKIHRIGLQRYVLMITMQDLNSNVVLVQNFELKTIVILNVQNSTCHKLRSAYFIIRKEH